MRFTVLRTGLWFAILLGFGVSAEAGGAQTDRPTLTFTPSLVEVGSPVLMYVDAPETAKLDGDWMGRKLEFFPGRDRHGWFALAGVDVEATVGPSNLRIEVKLEGRGVQDLSRTVEIHRAHYRTG